MKSHNEQQTTGRYGQLQRRADCRRFLSEPNPPEDIGGTRPAPALSGGAPLFFRECQKFFAAHQARDSERAQSRVAVLGRGWR